MSHTRPIRQRYCRVTRQQLNQILAAVCKSNRQETRHKGTHCSVAEMNDCRLNGGDCDCVSAGSKLGYTSFPPSA